MEIDESIHDDCCRGHVMRSHEAVAPLAAAAGARAQPSNRQATDSLGEDRSVGALASAERRASRSQDAARSDLPKKWATSNNSDNSQYRVPRSGT